MAKVRNELTGQEYDVWEPTYTVAGRLLRNQAQAQRSVRINSSMWGGEAWAPSKEDPSVFMPVTVLTTEYPEIG